MADVVPSIDQARRAQPKSNSKRGEHPPQRWQNPQRRDEEERVIGAVLCRAEVGQGGDAVAEALAEGLQPDSFSWPTAGNAFFALLAVHERGDPIDATAVHDEALRSDLPLNAGDLVSWMAADGLNPSHVRRYARRIVASDRARARMVQLDAEGEALSRLDFEAAAQAASRVEALPLDAGGSSWDPVDLGPVLKAIRDGDQAGVAPTMLARTDGVPLLYAGKVHMFMGPSESAKSWVAQLAAAERLLAGEVVLYDDHEDCKEGLVERMMSLGVPDDVIAERFLYARPDDPLDALTRQKRAHLIASRAPTLYVLDGVTEALTLNGWDMNEASDIAAFYAARTRPVARLGLAVIVVDHVGKDTGPTTADAIGSQHKRAGIDGAVYRFDMVKGHPFARGQAGRAQIKVAKDRPGRVRPYALNKTIGVFELAPASDNPLEPGAPVNARITPPADTDGTGAATAGTAFMPTDTMQALSRWYEAQADDIRRHGLPISQVIERSRAVVSARAETKKDAIEHLLRLGHWTEKPGQRRARILFLDTPYRTT